MAKYKRRTYFLKKGFQGRFVLQFLIVSVTGIVLAVGVFNFLAYRKIDSLLYSMTLRPDIAGSFFLEEALYSNIIAVSVVAVMCVLTSRAVFKKIAGPLSQIRSGLHMLQKGYLGHKIFLRAGDEFSDFAEKINTMSYSLDEEFSEMKKSVSELSVALRELSWKEGEKDIKILREKIAGHILKLEHQLGTFRK
jgi:methyl-accepting chemotaxis protein